MDQVPSCGLGDRNIFLALNSVDGIPTRITGAQEAGIGMLVGLHSFQETSDVSVDVLAEASCWVADRPSWWGAGNVLLTGKSRNHENCCSIASPNGLSPSTEQSYAEDGGNSYD